MFASVAGTLRGRRREERISARRATPSCSNRTVWSVVGTRGVHRGIGRVVTGCKRGGGLATVDGRSMGVNRGSAAAAGLSGGYLLWGLPLDSFARARNGAIARLPTDDATGAGRGSRGLGAGLGL